MKKLIIMTLIISLPTFGSSLEYSNLKSQIDNLENSLIQNFDVNLPRGENEVSFDDYNKAVEEVESQYADQVNLFQKVEAQLSKLRGVLASKSFSSELNQTEKEKLINSIDYANRIILQSRREEVEKIYRQLKSKLSHIPKLERLHGQLAEASEDDCPIKNLFFDKLKGILSFDVVAKSEEEPTVEKKMNFVLTQGDVSQGSVNSEFRHSGERREYVTQFQSRFPSSQGVFTFTLTQDARGHLKQAAFHQLEAKRPWVEIMGVQFGEEKENRSQLCRLSPN